MAPPLTYPVCDLRSSDAGRGEQFVHSVNRFPTASAARNARSFVSCVVSRVAPAGPERRAFVGSCVAPPWTPPSCDPRSSFGTRGEQFVHPVNRFRTTSATRNARSCMSWVFSRVAPTGPGRRAFLGSCMAPPWTRPSWDPPWPSGPDCKKLYYIISIKYVYLILTG